MTDSGHCEATFLTPLISQRSVCKKLLFGSARRANVLLLKQRCGTQCAAPAMAAAQQWASGGCPSPQEKKKICPSAAAAASHLVIITIIFIIGHPLPLTHPSSFFPSIAAHSVVSSAEISAFTPALQNQHRPHLCIFMSIFWGGLFFNACQLTAQLLLRRSREKIHDSRPADRLEA